MNTCKNCKHWNKTKGYNKDVPESSIPGYGRCTIIEDWIEDYDNPPKCFMKNDTLIAISKLITNENFGCTLFDQSLFITK